MAKADVTAQRLRELLHYDADTGVFTWIVDRSPKTRRGDVAGSIYSNGYRMIGIDWKYTSAHRPMSVQCFDLRTVERAKQCIASLDALPDVF